jgi:1,4-dihydroxy-2-naphthoate polyprenyltransferase
MSPAASVPAAAVPSLPKIWWVAMRPFSFPASVMSVLYGGVLGVTTGGGRLDLPMLVLAAVGMALMHGGTNALNDAYDYEKGLDRQVLPVSGAVVRGYLTPPAATRLAAVLFGLGALIGLVIAWRVGWVIVAIGVAGLATGVLYSATPAGLKYLALGDLAVFVMFGILGTLGGWVTQTGTASWLPVLWGVPISLLVIGILHANNWRDMVSDRARGCVTVANLLGDRGSALYYDLLLLAPFVLVLGFIVVPRLTGVGTPMPLTFAVVALAAPLALRNLGRARRRSAPRQPMDFLALDGATAQLELAFGALCTVGAVLAAATGLR